LEVLPEVETVNFGWNFKPAQPATANGADTLAVVPCAPEIVAVMCC